MRTLKYGGNIVPGDFIAVSNGNYINFGWYAGDGRGTLQYYDLNCPAGLHKDYLQFQKDRSHLSSWRVKQFEKLGFSRKLLWKHYINAVHATRVIKISHPEDIFTTPEDRKQYELSRQAMIELNFIKH